MKRKKNKSPQQLYQAARGNLLLMLIFSAVNVAFAAFGVDIYFLFSDYLAYMLALTGRVFLEYSDEGLYLAVGLAFAVLVLVPYLLCWIFSKKRRGWMIAALVLFAVDTGALVVDTLGSDDVLYNLPRPAVSHLGTRLSGARREACAAGARSAAGGNARHPAARGVHVL